MSARLTRRHVPGPPCAVVRKGGTVDGDIGPGRWWGCMAMNSPWSARSTVRGGALEPLARAAYYLKAAPAPA